MPHSHSEIYAKIDRAASISDRVSAAMLRHNMAALAERGTFHARMAMVKQHQMNRLTRVLKTLFAQATEIFAMGPKLKTVTFDCEAV